MGQEVVIKVLPRHLQVGLWKENLDWSLLQEIRIRVGQVPRILYNNSELIFPQMGSIEKVHIKEMLEYVSKYSVYAYEEELRQGFITVEGGHRVGVVGKAVIEEGNIKNLRYISAINLRVSHEVKGCAREWISFLYHENKLLNTLIISPPGCGKTTLLRDFIRILSKGSRFSTGFNVGVVDERSEIGGSYQGVIQNDLGPRTDLLDACPKKEGILMLIRSMSPQVIAVDEVGSKDDVEALLYAINSGCNILATIHGRSMNDIMRKKGVKEFLNQGGFERFIILGNNAGNDNVLGIYNENNMALYVKS